MKMLKKMEELPEWLVTTFSIFFVILFLIFPTIDTFQEYRENLKPLVEIAAIIVAGLWSYRLFIKKREDYTYAELERNITHWNLDNETVYLSVFIKLKNAGNVLLKLNSG